LFAGPSKRAVINSFGGVDEAMFRDNLLLAAMFRNNLWLAFACFAKQPMTKAQNRAAIIPPGGSELRKHGSIERGFTTSRDEPPAETKRDLVCRGTQG
jgi:hypothetical protein